jgi:hypothetical protein
VVFDGSLIAFVQQFVWGNNLEVNMKMIKSLILGSAAGLVAVGGAQAADLPIKAAAVEYVRICSLYGAGFYYLPGTDTCIKLGGYLRADTIVNSGNDYGFSNGPPDGAMNRLRNNFTSRARQDLTIDTRTATEYGVVRTFAELVFTWTGGEYVGNGLTTNATGGTTLYNSTTGTIGGASIGLYNAFIQFAGFTFGRAYSFFDAPWQSYPAGGPDTLPGGSNHVTGVNLVGYTAQFGNGFSTSISLQDPTVYDTTNIWNLSFPGGVAPTISPTGAVNFLVGYGAPSIAGALVAPDVVGNLKLDQAWGSFMLSAVAHNNHAGYYGFNETFGHPSDKWGWAVQAAMSIKNIPTGAGDVINMQAVYTDGASRYNFQSLFPTTIGMFGGTGVPGAYQSLGFAAIGDAVFVGGNGFANSGLETVKSWGFRGGYAHNWSPYWVSQIYGGYGALDYGPLATSAICLNAVRSLGLTGTCNPDFNIGVVGTNLIWNPVKGLAFTADVSWTKLDQKYSGTIDVQPPVTFAKPRAIYELRDQSTWTMLLRAQRNF